MVNTYKVTYDIHVGIEKFLQNRLSVHGLRLPLEQPVGHQPAETKPDIFFPLEFMGAVPLSHPSVLTGNYEYRKYPEPDLPDGQ